MKTQDEWRERLFWEIMQAQLLRHPRRIQLGQDLPALEGMTTIAGRAVTIAISVAPLFQHRLPSFFLRPWDALGFIPHIEVSGQICYLDQEGFVLDRRRPLEVIRAAFKQVQQTLCDGVTQANRDDFVDEFEVYWRRLTNYALAISSLEPLEETTEVVIGRAAHASALLRLAADARRIMYVPGDGKDKGPWTAHHAIYLPLKPGTWLMPPRPDQPFWSVEQVRDLLAFCSTENRARLIQVLDNRMSKTEYLIVQLPRPSGGVALFGLHFEGIGQQHPLKNEGRVERIVPIIILRRERSYLVQRGGGNSSLDNMRVLLVGCGAVGGHIALELARAGVGHLTLLDPDKLHAENTYRHVLGKRYWEYLKVQALQEEISRHFPYARVRAIATTIEQALTSGQVKLTGYDLIVSALGNPTSELALNERTHRLEDGPPIIFTWLEPLGIGGHALLTGMSNMSGCFECLYTPTEDLLPTLHNRAAFAASKQNRPFRRSLTGCGNVYTPYGSLDASQTANLAARMALDVLTGQEQNNRLRSWKGDSTAFLAEKYQLSSRYAWTTDELADRETAYPNPRCPICGTLDSQN